jgi:hypothetical protein
VVNERKQPLPGCIEGIHESRTARSDTADAPRQRSNERKMNKTGKGAAARPVTVRGLQVMEMQSFELVSRKATHSFEVAQDSCIPFAELFSDFFDIRAGGPATSRE